MKISDFRLQIVALLIAASNASAIEGIMVDAYGNELPMKDPTKHHILRNDTTKKFGTAEKVIGNVLDTRSISTTTPLAGGGDLSANRTLSITLGQSIQNNSGTVTLVGDTASPGNNKVYSTNGSGTRGWNDFPSSATGANPTASVGTSAVNGSAPTFMRSDAAPALSLSIAPTWTGLHTWQFNSLAWNAQDDTKGILLQNTTTGSNQVSPEIRWQSNQKNGGGAGTNHLYDFRAYAGGTASGTSSNAVLKLESQADSGGYTPIVWYYYGGGIRVGSTASTPWGDGVVNVKTGFQIEGNGANGHYLRGDGSKYVDGTIAAGDLPDLSATYQPRDSDLDTWAGITPGTGVGTALGVNVGSAGAFVINGGALGTPSSGNASNLTSFPTLNQNTTGSAASLTNARLIGGVSFNGTANIVPTNISGGNSTTLLGSMPYQSNTDTTTQLGPNTTTTKKFLSQTGDGANGAAPTWAQPAGADLSMTDVTTNNASTTAHGFLKKLDNTSTHYMDGQGNWTTPSGTGGDFSSNTSTSVDSEFVLFSSTGGKTGKRATGTGVVHSTSGVYSVSNVLESEITTADNTTDDVSTSKHGFAPKAPNDSTKFLDGTGAYSIPSQAPFNTQNAAYTFVLGDAGKTIFHDEVTARTYTIPANASVAYPIGTMITIINNTSGGTITLAITTDTLRRGDGTAGTGSRTIAADSVVTIIKTKSTEWFISGKFS